MRPSALLLLAVVAVAQVGAQPYVQVWENSNGNITVSSETPLCLSFMIMTGMNTWSQSFFSFLMLLALCYCFLGVAIIADLFMAAIEMITSKTVDIVVIRPGEGKVTEEVLTWNPTIANLTLMALGSSAPEILLAVIGTVKDLGTDNVDELGPAAIVGSAAFNLLFISAVCVYSVGDEPKRIAQFGVFGITATASVLAYIWLAVCLMVISPGEIDLTEAIVTFVAFPVLVILAYMADIGCCASKSKESAEGDGGIQLSGVTILPNDLESGNVEPQTNQSADKGTDFDAKQARSLLDKETGSSDEVAAQKVAQKMALQQKRVSPMIYRINAMKGLAGRKRVFDTPGEDILQITDGMPATVQLTASQYQVKENCGALVCRIMRYGDKVGSCRVRVITYPSSPQTAVPDKDYKHFDQIVEFAAMQELAEVKIEIIDDDVPEEDAFFEIRCELVPNSDCVLGPLSVSDVTIIDDDEPGMLAFQQAKVTVLESCGKAQIPVVRKNGSKGSLGIQWRTTDEGNAVPGTNYTAVQQQSLEFLDGETREIIEVEIFDNDVVDGDHNFGIMLFNPQEGTKIDQDAMTMDVKILDDDGLANKMRSINAYFSKASSSASFVFYSSSWAEQFTDAMIVAGEDGEEPSSFDYFMHVLTFGWKLIFAIVPPTTYCGGWAAFGVALAFIGGLTGVVGELATVLGCSMSLKPIVTAITIVALGTSLPDTFASRTAALSCDTADNAIGNITGSNAVNVFLGLGLPWLIGTCYNAANGRGNYPVAKDGLAFSVLVFLICALLCFAIILVRRATTGELGGNPAVKALSAFVMVMLWVIYVVLSSLVAYKLLPDPFASP